MVFSDYLFVFAFFPIFLLLYRVCPAGGRNALLLVFSLFFYWAGEGKGLWLLLAVIAWNYVFALLIERAISSEGRESKNDLAARWLTLGVGGNLAALAYFKYATFFTTNLNDLSSLLGYEDSLVPILKVALPLGVSFFVFQGISYLVDVYRRDSIATKSLLDFATYKSMFPQLVAGPIVRYSHVAGELKDRSVTDEMRIEGIHRFVTGFAKKVLLADTFAVVADGVFAVPTDELSASVAWLGAFSYSLQIYFDFSAYSDMAIGIGLMMGFRFPENFNYPYTARSIKDFWRRWHMTLSTWFRDYVYIPLGGNRMGGQRMYLNMLIVFFLTGLWHGAEWTFVVWGLWHGGFLIFERMTNLDGIAIPSFIMRGYTLLVVVVGWVLFRASDFEHAFALIKAMIGAASGERSAAEFVDPFFVVAAVCGVVFSAPVYRRIGGRVPANFRFAAATGVLAALFVLSCMKVLSGAYSPFLYFRF